MEFRDIIDELKIFYLRKSAESDLEKAGKAFTGKSEEYMNRAQEKVNKAQRLSTSTPYS